MDLLTAAMAVFAACSLHPDEQLVRAVMGQQSGGHPYYILDLTALAGTDSGKNRTDAETIVAEEVAKGHRLAVGPMIVPLDWARGFNQTAKDLWDGCVNMSIATAKLSEFDWQCQRPGRRRKAGAPGVTSTTRRACVLRKLASELGMPSVFVTDVLRRIYAPATGRSNAAARVSTPENSWGSGSYFPQAAGPEATAWPTVER